MQVSQFAIMLNLSNVQTDLAQKHNCQKSIVLAIIMDKKSLNINTQKKK